MTVRTIDPNPLIDIHDLSQRVYILEQNSSGSSQYEEDPDQPSPPPPTPVPNNGGNAWFDTSLPPPTNLRVTTGAFHDRSYIDMFWDPPTGPESSRVDSYELDIVEVGFGTKAQPRTMGTSARYYDVKPNTDYDVRVASIDSESGARSAYTVFVRVRTLQDATIPTQVTGLRLTSGIHSLQAEWDENPESDVRNNNGSYEVWLAKEEDFDPFVTVRRTSATIMGFTGVEQGTRYYVRVAAIDSSGNMGPFSEVKSTVPGTIGGGDIDEDFAAKYSHVPNYGFEVVEQANPTRAYLWEYDYYVNLLGAIYNITSEENDVRTGNRALSITNALPNSGAAVASDTIAANPTDTWYVSAYQKSNIATERGVTIRVCFGLTEDFALDDPGVVYQDVVTNEASVTAYTRHEGQVTVPFDRKWMRIVLYWDDPGVIATSYWDEVVAIRVVVAEYIKAGEINADHISSDTIETRHLKAEIIEAEHIKAHSVTADRLKTSTLEATIITIGSGGMIRQGRTSAPYHYTIDTETGYRGYRNGSSPFTGGQLMFSVDVANGTAYFQGEIGSDTRIYAPVIEGGIIRGVYIYGNEIHGSSIYGGQIHGTDIYASKIVSTTIHAGTIYSSVLISSIINASEINSSVITASLIRTARPDANRVEITPSGQFAHHIVFYTGDQNESSPGSIHASNAQGMGQLSISQPDVGDAGRAWIQMHGGRIHLLPDWNNHVEITRAHLLGETKFPGQGESDVTGLILSAKDSAGTLEWLPIEELLEDEGMGEEEGEDQGIPVPVYVQPDDPMMEGPGVWVKTGIDPFEIWVEDGVGLEDEGGGTGGI